MSDLSDQATLAIWDACRTPLCSMKSFVLSNTSTLAVCVGMGPLPYMRRETLFIRAALAAGVDLPANEALARF